MPCRDNLCGCPPAKLVGYFPATDSSVGIGYCLSDSSTRGKPCSHSLLAVSKHSYLVIFLTTGVLVGAGLASVRYTTKEQPCRDRLLPIRKPSYLALLFSSCTWQFMRISSCGWQFFVWSRRKWAKTYHPLCLYMRDKKFAKCYLNNYKRSLKIGNR